MLLERFFSFDKYTVQYMLRQPAVRGDVYVLLVERAALAFRDLRCSFYWSGSRARWVLRDLEWNSEKFS